MLALILAAAIYLFSIAAIHIGAAARYLPSNILINLIRTRRGLKWGVPAMLISAPYFAIAYWCTTIIRDGGPEWLHLIVLICIWSAFKFVLMGPISLVLLMRVRMAEYAAARRARHQERSERPVELATANGG